MANHEHLTIIKQGSKVWNEWREKNPTIIPNLNGADLLKANLRGADLSKADLEGISLNGADLREADFKEADLNVAHFNDAELHKADLSWSYLGGAHFRDARLSEADLLGAHLRDTHFRGADLRGASFNGAYLSGVNLSGADLSRATIGWTAFANMDLSDVTGLESVKHDGPSTIGIDTIYKSRGNIPEMFLRKAGVPENFITYMHSLTGKALDFYKCFISFTEADDLFSERLYNDLQGAGVRCWRWKEDARWGKNLMSSIDEAVRYYDKLVVICSEQSLKSPAVIREIERALQKEDEQTRKGQGGEVLFPLRLDDYIFDGWNHYRKADLLAKNVGDFRQWHEPEQYKKSFERLLRDLKAVK